MSRFVVFPLTLLAFLTGLPLASAQFPNQRVNQTRGATIGGLGGAVAGALIGDNNGEAGAGAAIGGVIGAVAGGILGNASDKEVAARQQQQIYYQQQQQAAVVQSAVSINDVVSMSRSGLSEGVIINQIGQRGVQTELRVPDIIALHQQGVSENVISAMQSARIGSQTVARAPQQTIITQSPVIVEEHYVVPHYAPPRVYYRPVPVHRHQRGGVYYGF